MNNMPKHNAPLLLVINTGSTTTKIAVFKGSNSLFEHNFSHSTSELSRLDTFDEQVQFRINLIEKILNDNNFPVNQFDLIMARGGLIKPVKSGVYKVNERMIHDLKHAPKQHASNLAAVIGYRLGKKKIPVYIADPVVVDELQDIARYAGHRLFERKSIFHALNHKAIGRKFASDNHKKYENLNLIIAHIGGGISVAAHKKGQVVDVNQALDGEGPFTPERSGTLPAGDLIRMAYSGKYNRDEMLKMITGKGGLVSYLETNNVKEIEKKADKKAIKILEAMAYQVAKSIGEMATVLKGDIDAIILTGGVAYSNFVTELISDQVKFIAPVFIYAGEDEIQALAQNGIMLYHNEIEAQDYL